MRRKDRLLDSPTELDTIITECQVCRLALSGAEGPYIVALNYGWRAGDKPSLYFHCATEGKKLDMVRTDPRAAFIIDRPLGLVTSDTSCGYGMRYESVAGHGIISIVKDPDEILLGLDLLMAHYGGKPGNYDPAVLSKTLVLKLDIIKMTGKRKA